MGVSAGLMDDRQRQFLNGQHEKQLETGSTQEGVVSMVANSKGSKHHEENL
jgi:hypothetical protein